MIEKINKWGSKGETGSKTVQIVTEILIGSFLAGEIGRGFGVPGGVLAANAIYLSQIGFFSSIWATIFGTPAWVGILGGAVGGGVAFFVISPALGALVERAVNQVVDLNEEIRKSYESIIKTIVYGKEGTQEKESLLGKSINFIDIVTEAVDNIVFVSGKVLDIV
jgi:hypothetical protein